jgi:hypothetical protein
MRSGFFSCYFNIPELGISESIPLTEYFPFRVLTPNSQNNTDTLKHQNGLSNLVNDKGRYHSLSEDCNLKRPQAFKGKLIRYLLSHCT